jgi:hypothetical protein
VQVSFRQCCLMLISALAGSWAVQGSVVCRIWQSSSVTAGKMLLSTKPLKQKSAVGRSTRLADNVVVLRQHPGRSRVMGARHVAIREVVRNHTVHLPHHFSPQRLLDRLVLLLLLLLTLLDTLLLRLLLRLTLLSLSFSFTTFSLSAARSSCRRQWLPSS